jgi:aldose 1-epimerase
MEFPRRIRALQETFANVLGKSSMRFEFMLVGSYRHLLIAAAAISLVGCQKPAPAPSESTTAAQPATPQIGGQDVVKLTRSASANGASPEFTSVTVLPGRGMNVFQITANVPGKGEIPVLASPSLTDAAAKLNGGPDDQNGNASFSFGGAFLVPYPNRIIGKLSPDGSTVTTEWHGKTITLPANWHNSADPTKEKHAMHGLILASQAEDVQTQSSADGQTVTGTIHAGDFGGHWLSKTDLNFTIALSGKAVDATITAKNVGTEDEPLAIGWHPYFAIPSGDRTQARLHVPGDQLAVVNNYDDVFPTGKLIPVKGTKWDFNAPDGKALGDVYLDDNWSKLKRTDGAVAVSLSDPASNYGVRVLGLSPEIKTVQVYAPPAKQFAAIEEQFNFADPFGKEWHGMDTGMITLKPGQSVTWHVRLELFQPNAK